MKKIVSVLLVVVMSLSLVGCDGQNVLDNDYDYDYDYDYYSTYSYYTSSKSYSYSYFTNKFGTSTTKCAKAGCSNYIASSGDTNCCVSHSNRCLECRCYIDGDAMYCMECLYDALY